MNRRLRKKKYVGEFQEFGFKVRFSFSEQIAMEERNSAIDDWIRLVIEKNGLQFGGGGADNVWSGFIALEGRGSVDEGHRTLVEEWFLADPRVSEYEIGPLTDAWHDEKEMKVDREE